MLCVIVTDPKLINIKKSGNWFNATDFDTTKYKKNTHAVIIEGYDIDTDTWILKNSDVLFNKGYLLSAYSANETSDTNK